MKFQLWRYQVTQPTVQSLVRLCVNGLHAGSILVAKDNHCASDFDKIKKYDFLKKKKDYINLKVNLHPI